MPLDIDDVKKDVVKRGNDGEILAETETITYRGETVDVEVYPPTIGDINEYDKEISNADFESMDVAALKVLCYKHYKSPDFKNGMSEAEFMDMHPARVIELFQALKPYIGMDETAAEGNPQTMTRQERAREMR